MRISLGSFEKVYQVVKLLDITKKVSGVLSDEELRMCGKLLQDLTTLLQDLDVDLLKSVCSKELRVVKGNFRKINKGKAPHDHDEVVTNG